MKKQPLLIFCGCFILGILFQEVFACSKIYVYTVLIVSLLLLISFFSKSIVLQRFKNISLGFFFFSVGIFSHYLNSEQPEIPTVAKKETVVFKLDKKLNSNEKNRRYEVTVFRNKVTFKSVLSVPKAENELDFAHFFRGEMYINRVEPPTADYQFDYRKYLGRKGIFFQSYLPNSYSVASKKDLDFPDRIREWHLETLQNINNSSLSHDTKEFLKGLILADRTEMDAAVTQDFTKSGLVHFLAISGTHMVVIFWFLMLILKPLFPTRMRNVPIILSLVLIWIFAVFIGYGNSVIRSCLMLSVYYGFVLLQRKPDLLHAMAVAAFAILIFDTNQIFDVGFQLSFLAVFGIFWLNEPISKLFPRSKNKVLRFFLSVFTVTLSAQMITLPLILYYFHQFSLISIIANLFVVPLSEIIIVFSLLMVVVVSVFGNIIWLNALYDVTVSWLLKVIHFFAGFNAVYFERIPFSAAEAFLLFVAIIVLRSLLIKRNSKYLLQFSFLLLLFFGLRFSLNYFAFRKNEALTHTYFKEKLFSVKNGDRVYFWLNEDADKAKIEKYIITPYLVSRRVKKFEVKTFPANTAAVAFQGKTYPLQ